MTKSLHTIRHIPLVAAACFAASCSDDLTVPGAVETDNICFAYSDSDDWKPASKSRGAEELRRTTGNGASVMVPSDVDSSDGIEAENNEPFYIYSYVQDGITGGDDAPGDVTDSGLQSRATGSGETSDTNLPAEICVTAMYTDDNGDTTPYLTGSTIAKDATGNIYRFKDMTRYWPATGKLFFSAYSPKGTMGIGDPAFNEKNEMYVNCKIRHGVWEHTDLVYSTQEQQCTQHTAVPMNFGHALTQVKFVYASTMPEGRVNWIRIRNVHREGTMTLPMQPGIRKCDWKLTDGITVNHNLDFTGITNTTEIPNEVYRAGADVRPGTLDIEVAGVKCGNMTPYAQSLMMLPQELGEDAEIVISFTAKVGNEDLFSDKGWNYSEMPKRGTIYTARIGGKGQKWEQGTTVYYKLSNASLDVTPILEIPGDCVTNYKEKWFEYLITSEATVTDGKTGEPKNVQVPWTMEYYDENGNKVSTPSWIKSPPKGSYEGTMEKSQWFGVAAAPYTESRPHSEWLTQQKSTFGDPEDLSKRVNANKRNTANCYVINHAGSYKFPLVYGNAIMDGKDFPEAYTYAGAHASHEHALMTFKNHLGNDITDPRIHKNAGCTPQSVELLWQDSQNLIREVKLMDGEEDGFKYIKFETGQPANLTEGNAVIAVRGTDGQIMWSWHIWFTDYKPRSSINQPDKYDPTVLNPPDVHVKSRYVDEVNLSVGETHYQEDDLMGVPLGWCSNSIRHYEGRSVRLRYTQSSKLLGAQALTKELTVTQTECWVDVDGYAPYYQFGRKDPLCPSTGERISNSCKDRTLYNIAGATVPFIKKQGPVDIQESIKNPISFYYGAEVTVTGGKGTVTTAGSDWCKGEYNNLWSANAAEKSDVIGNSAWSDIKTIYDPCPPGYEVPDFFVFSFSTFPRNGAAAASQAQYGLYLNSPYHGTYDPDSKSSGTQGSDAIRDMQGVLLYCNYMPEQEQWDEASGLVFFQAMGARSYVDGNLTYVSASDIRGYYWTSTAQFLGVEDKGDTFISPATWGTTFGFRPDQVMPQVQNSRSAGMSIRPIRHRVEE